MSYLTTFLAFIGNLFANSASSKKDLAEAQVAMSEALNNLASRVLLIEAERVDLVDEKAELAALLSKQLESNRIMRKEMASLRESNEILHEDNKKLLKHNLKLEAMIESYAEDMTSVTQELPRPGGLS